MESFFRNKLGSQLALAALAACFFVVPGKAQNTSKGRAETPACTSYPEWYCEPEAVPAQVASATAPQADGPSCTSYPEWYCEPEATPDQQKALANKRQEKGSKLQERKPKQEVSGAADSLDEGFERRP